VAARENSASAREMHQLPDLIKAITLNNKLDESRDLATMVQDSLVSNLRKSNKEIRSRGVKKAPFVVLIGAAMPSVLAEISFVSNARELALLKTPAYRQRIADALYAAVTKYRRSLKNQTLTALPER
jgi:N-acetylmuramoyl-L-alanine amidase